MTGLDVTKLVVDEVQIHTSRCWLFPKAIRLMTRQHLPVQSLVLEIYSLDSGDSGN
jgi:hypothetical protein